MKHEFKIVSGHVAHVERTVSELLNDGWQLSGTLAVYGMSDGLLMVQPLARGELEDHEREMTRLQFVNRVLHHLMSQPAPPPEATTPEQWMGYLRQEFSKQCDALNKQMGQGV